MAEKHANIEELVYDDHNFNQHTAEGMELLEKSIRENKFGRSTLIDKDNRIIAGNGIVEAATKTGTKKIRVIETDGDELIAVKRKDLSLDSQEGRRLALADNATSAVNLKWSENEMKAAAIEWGVLPDEWGVDVHWEESDMKKEAVASTAAISEDGLPDELKGLNLTPDNLPKIQGRDQTAMECVIIVFTKSEEPRLAKALGVGQINKVLYNVNELWKDETAELQNTNPVVQ